MKFSVKALLIMVGCLIMLTSFKVTNRFAGFAAMSVGEIL
jgi:hypothetical protein